jgi:hypothetical protein
MTSDTSQCTAEPPPALWICGQARWRGLPDRTPRGVHLWMAGWTTLRVAHAPTRRPSAARKLHRAPPPQEIEENKKHPETHSGIARPTTSEEEATNQPPTHTHSCNLIRATQHRAPCRSRFRSQRSRSPKYAVTQHVGNQRPGVGSGHGCSNRWRCAHDVPTASPIFNAKRSGASRTRMKARSPATAGCGSTRP